MNNKGITFEPYEEVEGKKWKIIRRRLENSEGV